MGGKLKVVACVASALALMLSLSPLLIAQMSQASLTEPEVIELIKQYKKNLNNAAPVIERRGVNFDLDPKIENALRKAGADDAILQEVAKVGPTSRASQKSILTTATGAQLQVPAQEVMAFDTMQNELDPNRRLQMVNEFEREFPKSQILSQVYAQGAKASQEKNDLNKAVEYGEKSLKLDPDNLPALLIVAISVSQPSMLRASESEKTARLAEARNDADHVLKMLGGLPKQGSETDEQLLARKGVMAADAHFVLGMVALLRDEPAKAIEEFKNAIASSAKPTPQYYYRLGDAYSTLDKTDEAIEAFKKARELGFGTAMEQLANKRIAELKK